MIESRTTRSLRTALAALPEEVRAQARQAYRLFRADPAHPSLRFKKIEQTENVYSVRIGLGYRALVFSMVPSSSGFGSALTLTTTAVFDESRGSVTIRNNRRTPLCLTGCSLEVCGHLMQVWRPIRT